MAVITLAKDDRGNQLKYQYEQDVIYLVRYAIHKSRVFFYEKVYPFGDAAESIANQILFVQKQRNKALENRLIHLIISFRTGGYERFIEEMDIRMIMDEFIENYFQDCQRFICLHSDTPGHLHIHFIINPVRLSDYKVERLNLMGLMRSMAGYLATNYDVAVQRIDYYDGLGRLRMGEESGKFLYQNKLCKEKGISPMVFT